MSSRLSSLAIAALLAALAAPALHAQGAPGAQAAGSQRRCVLGFRSPTGETRTNGIKLPSGKYNFFQGNGVIYFCQGQGNELRADSAEYYGEPGILYMIGNVHYTETRVKADAEKMTYFQADDRLLAEGNVVAVLQSGTTMRGPRVEYWRTTPARPRQRMVAPGRPHMQLVQVDSTGRKEEPVNVVANTITLDGDSLVYAGGKVEITRPDIDARGDSAFLDSGREYARLMRNPSIDSKGERPFNLVGETIDVFSRNRQLERVLSMRRAVATSQDMRLASDTLDLRVRQNKLERAYAWGPTRARVTSPERDILADSLDISMPGQQLREVRALRGAYAATAPDTTQLRSTEKDWIRGDTIVARFDSAPPKVAARPLTPPARTASPATAAASSDSSRKPRPRDIVANGNASSFYQIASRQGPKAPPAINYVRGRIITVAFDSSQVRTVTVVDSAIGVYLEPATDTSRAARAARARTAGQGAAPGAPAALPGTKPGQTAPAGKKPAPTTTGRPRGTPAPSKPAATTTTPPGIPGSRP